MARIPTTPKADVRVMMLNVVDDFVNPNVVAPPLYMQVNPTTMSLNHAKKTTRTQTFSAYYEEYWGDELDTITCSNSTGGFVDPMAGYTNVYKTRTEAYFNFQNILDIYRNNGNVFDDQGRIIKRGYSIIYFQPGVYMGYFENFDYTETADSPYKFTFNFTFKVEKSYTSI